jgi:hypothetical protein
MQQEAVETCVPNPEVEERPKASAKALSPSCPSPSLVPSRLSPLALSFEPPFATSSIHVAAATGDFRLVMSLLQADSSAANLRGPKGWIPLHLAAREGHSPVVMAILAYAPEVEVDGREGQAEGLTPLMLAAVMGRPFTVYLLVTGGRADLSLRSRGQDACTAAELARDRHQHAIADMLVTMQAHYEVRGVSDCLFLLEMRRFDGIEEQAPLDHLSLSLI